MTTQQAQHTSGPWTVKSCGASAYLSVDGADKRQVAKIPPRFHGPSLSDGPANARLIAAAPDLLAALELAVRYLEHPDVLAVTQHMALPGSVPVDRARAAIERATGGHP